jgi:hypothetical protein
MDTPALDEVALIKLLSGLIEVDLNAIAAYESAIERVGSGSNRRQLRAFLEDHERHVDALSEQVAFLGGVPPAEGDLKSLLSRGRVLVANFAGDAGILKAMRHNERPPLVSYRDAVLLPALPAGIRSVLNRALSDEMRHSGFIGGEVERLPQLSFASLLEAV